MDFKYDTTYFGSVNGDPFRQNGSYETHRGRGVIVNQNFHMLSTYKFCPEERSDQGPLSKRRVFPELVAN